MFIRRCKLLVLTSTLMISFFAHASLDWTHFKARFLMADGRIIDTGNHYISHSEGQGYGMLFAVASNDQASFNRIWQWTERQLKNPHTGLFYWRYNPVIADPIEDKNDATDGDVLIAWALLKAGQTWHDPRYIRASDNITSAVLKYTVIDFAGKTIILPGAQGFNFNSSVDLNPSYFIFPAWRDLAKHTHLAVLWQLIKDSQSLVQEMGWGAVNLPTDWVTLHADGQMSPAKRWPARMSYDAIRIPLYILWDQPSSPLLSPWRAWFRHFDRTQTPAWVNVYDGQSAPYVMQGGLQAVRDLIMGNTPHTRIDSQDDYYSASLKLLSALAAQRF